MDKIETIEDLKKLAADAFHVVMPSKRGTDHGTVMIPVKSYAELSYYLIDVIRVSVAALDAERESITSIKHVSSAVSGILEKMLDIIPLEEMELLDEIRKLVAAAHKDDVG